MRHVDASVARRSFSRLYHEVGYGGERVIIENHGRGLVALVPAADIEMLAPQRTAAGRTAPDRAACLALLRRERKSLERAGVLHVALFGSVARGEAGPASDVDVLVDLDPKARIGLVGFTELRERLCALFGREVDLVSRRALKPEQDKSILHDAAVAF